jgi:hypothetical protein
VKSLLIFKLMFPSSTERIDCICHKMDVNQRKFSGSKKNLQQSIADNWKNP